jgi:hypothetical protein
LGESELSDWELRVQYFRVFYDVIVENEVRVVKVKAVGHMSFLRQLSREDATISLEDLRKDLAL